jgi:methionyl-tRNA formyltransferase
VRVLLVAEEAAGIRVLRMLLSRDEEVVAVVAADGPRGTSGPSVHDIARDSGIPTWDPRILSDPDAVEAVRSARIDLTLNVHSLRVIDPAILDAPRMGSFNLHPGPLPRYAGLNAPSWAIYHREPEHGVTVHRMSARIDAGSIAYQERFSIGARDTGLSVSARCVTIGLRLLERLLDDASTDPALIPREAQDMTQRSYHGREIPRDGWIDWSRPAREVEAFVRAADYYPLASPWGHPRTRLGTDEIGIVSGAPSARSGNGPPGSVRHGTTGGVDIACGQGWVNITRVFVGGRYVAAGDGLPMGSTLLGQPGEASARSSAARATIGAGRG